MTTTLAQNSSDNLETKEFILTAYVTMHSLVSKEALDSFCKRWARNVLN